MNDDLKNLERVIATELAGSFFDNPGAWKWSDADCTSLLGPSGLMMSTYSFTVYSPIKVRFGFWNRRRISRAVRRWKRAAGNDLAKSEHRRGLLALHRYLAEPVRMAA